MWRIAALFPCNNCYIRFFFLFIKDLFLHDINQAEQGAILLNILTKYSEGILVKLWKTLLWKTTYIFPFLFLIHGFSYIMRVHFQVGTRALLEQKPNEIQDEKSLRLTFFPMLYVSWINSLVYHGGWQKQAVID